MTASDLTATLRRLCAEAGAKGHEAMILSVSRPLRHSLARPPKRRREERVRIAPGLFGRWMGDFAEADREGHIVDVPVEDVERWLRRRDVDVETTEEPK